MARPFVWGVAIGHRAEVQPSRTRKAVGNTHRDLPRFRACGVRLTHTPGWGRVQPDRPDASPSPAGLAIVNQHRPISDLEERPWSTARSIARKVPPSSAFPGAPPARSATTALQRTKISHPGSHTPDCPTRRTGPVSGIWRQVLAAYITDQYQGHDHERVLALGAAESAHARSAEGRPATPEDIRYIALHEFRHLLELTQAATPCESAAPATRDPQPGSRLTAWSTIEAPTCWPGGLAGS